MKYFLLGAFASGFLVYGIALVFGATGSTDMGEVVASLHAGAADPGLMLAGAALILVGLGFKVAVVPFHMWTPDVYQGAPSAVVAFMSVGAKAGGFAALLRVFVAAFPELASSWGTVAMWISALTMTWGNVAAIAQSNIKRMLAYSSIAHAGYILMVLPAAAQSRVAPAGISAALFYLLAYLVSNLGAWAVVIAVEKAEGGGLAIEDYAGLARRRPGLALAMALFMLSLTGLPPTVGFIGKFFVFRAALDAGLIWLALVGALTSLVSAYYYLRVVVMMFMRPGEPETAQAGSTCGGAHRHRDAGAWNPPRAATLYGGQGWADAAAALRLGPPSPVYSEGPPDSERNKNAGRVCARADQRPGAGGELSLLLLPRGPAPGRQVDPPTRRRVEAIFRRPSLVERMLAWCRLGPQAVDEVGVDWWDPQEDLTRFQVVGTANLT
jgi:NADH:ubiquinone oxidoreductase subunit 5 (subunit L)/multisubunit Na+/H+ antiporter MnhA subunit